jgi:hypothetical protein
MKPPGRPRRTEPTVNIYSQLNASIVRKIRKICNDKGIYFRQAMEDALLEYIAKCAFEKKR